jgi:hypothetical protein
MYNLVKKSEAKNKQAISKLEKQQTKERKQNTKILIKNEFMTLIFVSSLQKRMCAL